MAKPSKQAESSMAASGPRKALVEIGYVARTHGVRGDIRGKLHNSQSQSLVDARKARLRLVLGDGMLIDDVKVIGGGPVDPILRVSGVSTREKAQSLVGAGLWMHRDDLSLAPDEVLYADLIGCDVWCTKDTYYGRVAGVFFAGASDILVVRNRREERMVPYVDEWVADVNLESRTIRIIDAEQWDVVTFSDRDPRS